LLFIPSFTFDQNPEGLVVGEFAADINLGKEEGMTQRYEVRRLFGTKYPGNLQENIWFQTFLDEEETSFADVIPFFLNIRIMFGWVNHTFVFKSHAMYECKIAI
jgi:hypothetical protein